MKHFSEKSYITLSLIFVASLGAALFFFRYLPGNAVGVLAGIPAIVSLFGALFELSRDSIAHQRALAMEEAKNHFTVGATSHMANIAFDKHVLFCEAYVAKMQEALMCLFTDGPTDQVIPIAKELTKLRREWSVWLTTQLEEELELYERALYRIGAQFRSVNRFDEFEGRNELIERMFIACSEVLGDEKDTLGNPLKGNVATQKVIGNLREVLGISALTYLRSELIDRASKSIKDS